MSDDFFSAFGDEIEADWDEVTEERVNTLFNKLEEQDAERIFTEMKNAIDVNNRNKAIAQIGFLVLQEAAKLGLKALKG